MATRIPRAFRAAGAGLMPAAVAAQLVLVGHPIDACANCQPLF